MTLAETETRPGVRLTDDGGTATVYSNSATSVELVVFDTDNPNRVVDTVALEQDGTGYWTGFSGHLRLGSPYAFRVDGPDAPRNAFSPELTLLDPYARGVVHGDDGGWRGVVVDESFDWGDGRRPKHLMSRSVIYEAHVKGLSEQNPDVPADLRGTYAGVAHPATIAHLNELGVTAVELLPVHAFVSESHLRETGLTNYWGYNTLNFFTPHPAYATHAAQQAGPSAVLREFKGMVRLLHQAGIEVILDVVYNHTSEEGRGGPTSSLRGIDNASYYRQTDAGDYIDDTGCGNSLDFGQMPARRLVLDSLRYWADEVRVDGFRFDLATVLGRDESGEYTREHPLLYAIADDPVLRGRKLIAEPWDVGPGGWQTGNFPDGWSEWNDRYRDRARTFWLRDIADAREHGAPPTGVGSFATRLAGSSNTFAPERGPVASLNFVTAHDGFTLADLVSYDHKHNEANREDNRDGSNDNRSFNHGVEGATDDAEVLATRRRAMRNLLGTLLLSAGVPMITAGDEFGRTQHGNNNAYCQDSELTWLDWGLEDWQRDLLATTQTLVRLRAENPALRPLRYARLGASVPGASEMDWFDASGATMSQDDWQSPENRTLQYLAASTPEFEEPNRILLIVHGLESDVDVTLPPHEGVTGYTLLWDSAEERPAADRPSSSEAVGSPEPSDAAPGSVVRVSGTSMRLYRAHG